MSVRAARLGRRSATMSAELSARMRDVGTAPIARPE